VDNDFVQSSKEIEVVFSATPLANDNPSNRIIPQIYDADTEEGYKPTEANIRVLYYGGLLPSNPSWDFIGLQPAPLNQPSNAIWTAQNNYPYAGHWDNPLTPTLDINFQLPYELYYQPNGFTGTPQVTNAGLFNVYHRNYINEVTDKDSKVMTALFYLEPTDINTLDFRDQIVIDNAYWRLNKVMNYNPFKEGLTKVELIKVKDVVRFNNESKDLNSGGFLGKERMPNPSTEIKTNGNKYPPFQGKVSGRENSVGHSVTAFKVVGSNNTIGEGSRNIVILGDRNEVIGGLHNVQLINTNGVTITESNTTFINGKQQENRDVLDGSKDSVRALNGGTNIFTVDGGEDIVQTQFSDSAIYYNRRRNRLMATQDSRIKLKRSTVNSTVPTVPSSNDHTDGTWIATDIYKGELFYNQADGVLWTRGDSGIECIQGTAKLTIATADVLHLNTTPIEIVAAPGAGYAIEVISASMKMVYVSATYATNTSLN
jgi:hypothetical protein